MTIKSSSADSLHPSAQALIEQVKDVRAAAHNLANVAENEDRHDTLLKYAADARRALRQSEDTARDLVALISAQEDRAQQAELNVLAKLAARYQAKGYRWPGLLSDLQHELEQKAVRSSPRPATEPQ